MRSWLKKLRKEKAYTQAYIAGLMQISRQSYASIEQGIRQADLDFSKAVKLSEIFGISLDDIKNFEKEDSKNEHNNRRNKNP